SKAVHIFEEGIEKTKYSPLLVTDLARYYELTEDIDKAIKLYEDVLIHDELNIIASNNLAMLLADYRGDESSLNRAERLIDIIENDNNPVYMDTIGWVLYKQNKLTEAIPYLESAVDAYPELAVLNYHLGMAYLKAGEYDKAKSALMIATSTENKYLGFDEAKKALEKIN
ncbi:MAG: tetratricopeptide repeat protein, partial [Pseudomonadota bacterium]